MASIQFQARHLVDQMALSFQAALLLRFAPNEVSDAFCNSRLVAQGVHNYGARPKGTDTKLIIERGDPAIEKSVPEWVAAAAA